MAVYYIKPEAETLMFEGKEASVVYLNGQVHWEAGNFRTADGELFATADGMTFNVKQE